MFCHNGRFKEYSSFWVSGLIRRLIQPLSSLPVCLCSLSSHLFLSFYQLFQLYHPLCLCVCYPSQTALSFAVFLPPNLLFVLCHLQHSLVMFFFLRSHFRTSERDQEKIGLRKPAVKGSSAPFALQIAAQHSETFRPSSSLSEKQVVSRSTCLVSPFDASIPSELPQLPAPNLPNQGLVSSDVTGWSHLFLSSTNTFPHYIPLIIPLHFHLWFPHLHLPLNHTLADILQLHYIPVKRIPNEKEKRIVPLLATAMFISS